MSVVPHRGSAGSPLLRPGRSAGYGVPARGARRSLNCIKSNHDSAKKMLVGVMGIEHVVVTVMIGVTG